MSMSKNDWIEIIAMDADSPSPMHYECIEHFDEAVEERLRSRYPQDVGPTMSQAAFEWATSNWADYYAARERAREIDDEILARALSDAGYDSDEYGFGGRRLSDMAPDSDGADTSPGSRWDRQCDTILADVQVVLPEGYTAEWVEDDIVVERLAEENKR